FQIRFQCQNRFPINSLRVLHGRLISALRERGSAFVGCPANALKSQAFADTIIQYLAKLRMNAATAIAALGALGQPTRLAIVRRLLAAWPEALPAGALARLCGTQPSTLSEHLAVLARAGLVRPERAGRTINYRAEAATLRRLMTFLARDCCGDR